MGGGGAVWARRGSGAEAASSGCPSPAGKPSAGTVHGRGAEGTNPPPQPHPTRFAARCNPAWFQHSSTRSGPSVRGPYPKA